MWKKLTLTTASNTAKVSFRGRGSIFAGPGETWGSGALGVHPVTYVNDDVNGAESVATDFLDSPIDGTTIKSIDCPAGHYQLNLAGSTGATVNVWYNDQFDLVKD